MKKVKAASKKVIGITIVGMLVIGIFTSIAFIFFKQGNLERFFTFALQRSIKTVCTDCTISVSNFNIIHRDSMSFQINTDLTIKTHKNASPVLSTENTNLEFDLSKVFTNFFIPIKINADALKLNLDAITYKNLNTKKLLSLFAVLDNKHFFVLETLEIKNSVLTVNQTNYAFNLSKTTKENLATNILTVTSPNSQLKIEAIELEKDGIKTTKYKINNWPAKFITSFVPSKFQNSFLDKINEDLFISGVMETKFGPKTRILNAKFYHQVQKQQDASDPVKFLLSFTSKDWHDKIDIKKLNLSLPKQGELISAQGYIQNHSKLLGKKSSLLLSFKTEKFNLNSAHDLWPKTIASDAKNWTTTSIKNGELINLEGRIYVRNIYSSKPGNILFSGYSKFQNLDLKYMPEFPQIKALAGTVTLTNSMMIFNIRQGKMIDVSIEKGSSVRLNLTHPELPLIIHAKSHGPLKDFIGFINEKSLLQLKNKKINLQKIGGLANASVNIKIPLSKEVCLNNLKLDVDAKLDKVQFFVLDKFTLQGPLTLNIHNYLLSIQGNPLINNNKSKFNWQTHLKGQMAFDHKLIINTIFDASTKNLSLVYEKMDVSKGKIFLNTQYISKPHEEQIIVDSNLDNPRIYIQDINLLKNANKKSSFNLVLTNENGRGWKTKKCNFTSDEESINIDSYFELSNNLEEIKKLDSTIKSKNNNIKVNLVLNKKEGKFFIYANHIVPNQSHLLQLLNSQSFSKDRKVYINIKVDKATMHNDITFNNITGKFECYKNVCKNSALSMEMNDKKNHHSTLKIYKNNKAIVLRTNNAAALLKGLNTYSDIEGGNMIITLYPSKGNYLQRTHLEGSVYVRNFKALKTPIIAKLILMTPFTQIVEQLKGQNLIHFKNFTGSFIVADNIIKLRASRATGDLLTVTLDGHINLKEQTLSLQGELVPNCFFNKLMSKIQDTKDKNSDKYQLATHYTISGNLNDPQIHVNPISVLVSLFTKPLSIL